VFSEHIEPLDNLTSKEDKTVLAIWMICEYCPVPIKLTKPVVASYLSLPFTEGILILRYVKVLSGAFHIAITPGIVMEPKGL
jgi:hypothetical protein